MKTPRIKRFLILFALILFQVGICANIEAQQTVHGCIPGYIKQLALRPIARLDSTKIITLGIGLSLQNQQALTNLLQQLYTPGSTNFHQWLTPSEFTAQFTPSQADYQGVVNYLEANGFTVTKTYPNRMLIDASGTVGEIENAFHLTMMVYNHPSGKGTFYAPDSEPTLNVTTPIAHISGLRNDIVVVSHAKFTPLSRNGAASPLNNTGSMNGLYASKDIRAAYAPGVSLTGSGQTVGLLELDGFYYGDISSYESNTGLTNNPPTVDTVLVDGFNGNPLGDENEVTLDIEMAMAMAPNLSKIVSYETTGSPYTLEGHFNDILAEMVNDNYIKQFSCSWTLTSGNEDMEDATADNSFLQMAADGQSFFQASGDGDAVTNSTWISGGDTVYSYFGFPADDPYVTSVGGTELRTTGPGGSYVSEVVWNPDIYYYLNYAFEGSSGGVSNLYSIPSWQHGANPSNNQVSSSWRNVPDVALVADSLYEYVDGNGGIGNGTSAAAPLWAGFTAMVNQQEVANGESFIGFINPAIYRIGHGSGYAPDFHDIPTGYGTNKWSGSGSDFTSTGGYDLCTGWGTPNGQALINDLGFTNLTFTSNFTVNSGTVLELFPGTHITFSNGASLIVNGALSAVGTPTNPITFTSSSGTWGGIQFNNSTSSSTIKYATIQNASDGIYENNSDVYVANCTIQNNSTGVYCYASSDSIFNNVIQNNSGYGIYASNVTTKAYYRGNTFNNNGYTMYCNNAVPSYSFNRATDLYGCIVATSSNEVNIWTEPTEGYQMRGYNVINCNGEPNVAAENYSVIYMGYDLDGGYNTLCETNYPYLDATNHSTILADNNYWGGGPNYLKDGTSTVLVANPLSSDPNNAGCDAYDIATGSRLANSSQLPDTSQTANEFSQAVAAGESGNVTSAKSMLETIINGNYDNKYSPLALLFYDGFVNHTDSSQYKNIVSLLNNVAGRPAGDSLRPFAIRLLAREVALSKDFVSASKYNSYIVQNYPDSIHEPAALYDLVEYNMVVAHDTSEAEFYLSRLTTAYPNENITSVAKMLFGQKIGLSKSQKQNQPIAVEKSTGSGFYLEQAYPNPFNPTTTLTYNLPANGHVTLKVYDILGREVATLIDGYQDVGIHSASFDGSSLSSGIYFYRITAPGVNQVKKMILIK